MTAKALTQTSRIWTPAGIQHQEVVSLYPPMKVILMGDSAGGNLILSMAVLFKKFSFVQSREIIMLSPVLDLSFNEKNIPINYYEYPNMNHVFIVYPIPEAKQAMKRVINIIRSEG